MNDNRAHGLKRITYETALRKSWEELKRIDQGAIAEHLAQDGGRRYIVPMFGEEHIVDLERREVTLNGQEVHSFIGVLVLHYLLGCRSAAPTDQLITFREVPGGEVYYPAFKKRAIDTLVEVFGDDPDLLIKAGASIGAERGRLGGASVVVSAFPKVPVTAVVWEGDEEVPSSGNILFDSSIVDILPMEDVSIVGNLVSSKLRKAAGRELEGREKHPDVLTRG